MKVRLALAMLGAMLGGCDDPPPAARRVVQGEPDAGRRIALAKGCNACHLLPGINGPQGRVGPSLEDFAQRGYIAGRLPNTPRNVERWLRNPPAVAPETAMPDLGLTVEETRDLAAFLMRPR